MFDQIEIWKWVALFVTYATFDCLYAIYIRSVYDMRPLRASFLSMAMYMLTAYGTIEYVNNPYNLIPILAGGFLGTYVTLWFNKRKSERKGKTRGGTSCESV